MVANDGVLPGSGGHAVRALDGFDLGAGGLDRIGLDLGAAEDVTKLLSSSPLARDRRAGALGWTPHLSCTDALGGFDAKCAGLVFGFCAVRVLCA